MDGFVEMKGESGNERGADFVYVCESCFGEPPFAPFCSPSSAAATQRTASAEQAHAGGTGPVSISPATGWSIARQSLPRRNWPKRLLSRGRSMANVLPSPTKPAQPPVDATRSAGPLRPGEL